MARNWTLQWEAPEVTLPTSAFAEFSVQNNRPVNAFDTTTDESVILEGVVPAEHTGSGTLKIRMLLMSAATATTSRCQFEVVTEFIAEGESLNVDAFDANVDSGNVAFTATAYQMRAITITISPTSVSPVAGDKLRIKINRDAGYTPGGADSDYAGDVLVVAYELYEEA